MVNDKFIKDKFPAYYHSLPCACPHVDALEQDVEAFRFCESDSVTPDDFLSYYQLNRAGNSLNPSYYSVSLSPSIEDAQKLKKKFPQFRQLNLAKGQIKAKLGPSLLNNKMDHFDWWLYENVEPWHDFMMLDGY